MATLFSDPSIIYLDTLHLFSLSYGVIDEREFF